ncbi:glucoamylase family protein [Jiangella gansuensis]|uniref:glucoamylase family protein n=1 Tax=Jiangella gansuensis TaxID=281473 RepID=UPI00047B75E4|nr:glucoamylase family protein [Jiangella gansuensis]
MRSLFRQSGVAAVVVTVSALVAGAMVPTQAATPASSSATATGDDARATLQRYAEDTWASFVAMTDDDSGLPADSLHHDGTRSDQTSTTNIGAYMWSAVVAEELGIIDRGELVDRLSVTIATLERLKRHEESGQYFNWYDHRTGEVITTWPDSGEPIVPHLSSVDNGWLATALQVVRASVPELAEPAGALFESMDFGFYYRPEVNRILFHYAPSTGDAPCCYDTLVSESRIASYIGIAKGELPREHYFGTWRSFPDTCDWSWQQQKPVGEWRDYLHQDVWEGAYRYRGMEIVPGWGGSMFEALMPTLFVPEEQWGRRSWNVNHPLTVRAHIEHGLEEAQYGYWGFSPANDTEGGYRVYGVPWIGMDPTGYPSNNDGTTVDPGFDGCDRPAQPLPGPEDYTNGVVTPHASFLALRYAPEEALENLANLERDFGIYTDWGFRDTVNVDTGVVDEHYLALDQGMIMGAIGNHLAGDMLRDAFVTPKLTSRVRPVMAMEEFANFR